MPQVTFGGNLSQTSLPPAAIAGGVERIMVGTFAVPSAWTDATDDLILLPPIPSDAVLHEFSLANDDLGATLVVTTGLCDQFGNDLGGGESRDAYKGVDVYSVANNLADKRFAVLASTTLHHELWRNLALAVDPAKPFFPCIRVTTAETTPLAGNVTYRLRYSVA